MLSPADAHPITGVPNEAQSPLAGVVLNEAALEARENRLTWHLPTDLRHGSTLAVPLAEPLVFRLARCQGSNRPRPKGDRC